MHYEGTLARGGTKFDSSYDFGEPLQVIAFERKEREMEREKVRERGGRDMEKEMEEEEEAEREKQA